VLMGKHNMDEFGMGSSCENSAFFDTHNPGTSSVFPAARAEVPLRPWRPIWARSPWARIPAVRCACRRDFCNVTGLNPLTGACRATG